MSASRSEPGRPPVDDELIQETEASESGTVRNLFDLRVIIGGLFTLYGVYLAVYGLLDDAGAVDKAAGVRINLWTGLGMLALGLGFLAWAKLRPLTLEAVREGQPGSDDSATGREGSRRAGGH
jgi:hypothetical protein